MAEVEAEVEIMAPKLTKDQAQETGLIVLQTEVTEPYNRFVEEGVGLIVDNSNVTEIIDWSPWEEGEDE